MKVKLREITEGVLVRLGATDYTVVDVVLSPESDFPVAVILVSCNGKKNHLPILIDDDSDNEDLESYILQTLQGYLTPAK